MSNFKNKRIRQGRIDAEVIAKLIMNVPVDASVRQISTAQHLILLLRTMKNDKQDH